MSAAPSARERGEEGGRVGRRATARLAAVQALYQMELGGGTAARTIEEFRTLRLGREIEGERYHEADAAWFAEIVVGVEARQAEIDERLGNALDKDRRLDRLEAVLRAILRAAAYELLARPDVPTRVVISEYLDVAHAFFASAAPAFANGVLDRLARECRAGEMRPDEGR